VLDLAYSLTRPLLFRMDPEDAHHRVIALGASLPGLLGTLAQGPATHPALATEVSGLSLSSPVGLAAGLDKNGEAILLWEQLGFGFVEVGTVTPKPQPGNPRPRVHRLVQDQALVNSMGFPSAGVEAIQTRLSAQRNAGKWPSIPVGFNLGKNKDTAAKDAASDYSTLARSLSDLADFFVVNVSSPNTPGLRALQEEESLAAIVGAVLANAKDTPVWVKLSPDLEDAPLAAAVRISINLGVNGIVATNTTVSRPTEASKEHASGGLSGAPLFELSRSRIQVALDAAEGRVPVIGVGGVDSAQRAQTLLDMGCRAVELYTGLIFAGPGLVGQINQGLVHGA